MIWIILWYLTGVALTSYFTYVDWKTGKDINFSDDHGWAGIRCERERIVDWFGPSDFRKTREVMKNETLPGRS